MTETIDFKLTLDATSANRALDETRKRAEALGGGYDTLQKGMGQLKERLEKQAAAIAIVSHAFGQHDSAIGKAVSGIGTLAAAYGAGGPLGLALAVAVPAFEKLNQAYEDAASNSKVYAQSVAAIQPALQALTDRALEPQRQAIKSLREELERFGKDARQQQIDAAQMALAGIEGDLARLERNRPAIMQRALDSPEDAAVFRNTDRSIARLKAAQVDAQAKLDEITRMVLELDAKEADRNRAAATPGLAASAAKDGAARAAAEEDAYREMMKVKYGQRLDAHKKALADQLAADKAAADMEIQLAKDVADMKVRYDREQAAQASARKAEIEAQARDYAQIAATLASAIGSSAAAGVAGQEEALAAFVAAASQAAGGIIMLEGGKLLSQGISEIFSSSGTNPHGYIAAAGGAALVAAGSAVQTGGPLAVQALMGQAGAAGAAGAAGPQGSASTNPARVGTGSSAHSSRGGGSTVINIVYGGASGPTADQGAQAVVQGLRRAGRRGLTPVEVR